MKRTLIFLPKDVQVKDDTKTVDSREGATVLWTVLQNAKVSMKHATLVWAVTHEEAGVCK